MIRKASVLIEKDEHGFYAWCPELKGCQSQGATIEDALAYSRSDTNCIWKRCLMTSGTHC
jgi:hypothetical protein